MNYYDYGYEFGYDGEVIMEDFMAGFGVAFLSIIIMLLLVFLAVSAAKYIFRSLGLYAIAKRRGIRNPWMAWVPVLYTWIVGSISDQYQYVVKGKVRNKRTVLLVGYCAILAVSVTANVSNIVYGWSASAEDALMVISVIAALSNLVLGIVFAVFYYMAMYDLYTSVSPANNVLFLVLSIIFQITEPFFLFFNRNKDGGMPPRKEEPKTYIPETAAAPEQEPAFWETSEE